MEEYKWASFLQGFSYGKLIKISNAKELGELQKLAKQNKLFYYEWFVKEKYKEILHILEINAKDFSTYYKNTNGGKQFLVEYSYNGFTFALLNEYDNDKMLESEWEIIPMSEIIKELKGE